MPPSAMRNIVSIDGGPLPTLTLRIAYYVEQQLPGWLAATDVFVGTSGGALAALFLAMKVTDGVPSLQAIQESIAFNDAAIKTLSTNPWQCLKFAAGCAPLTNGKAFMRTVNEAFGDRTLASLDRSVAVVSYKLDVLGPQILTNFGVGALDPAIRLADIALASSAMPLASPFHQWGQMRYLDGAMVANNPAMIALAQVLAFKFAQRADARKEERLEIAMRGVNMLSLGASEAPDEVRLVLSALPEAAYKALVWVLEGMPFPPPAGPDLPWQVMPQPWDRLRCIEWGWFQLLLMRPLLLADVMFQGSIREVTYQATQLLGDRFARVNPPMWELLTVLGLLFTDGDGILAAYDTYAQQVCADPNGSVQVALDTMLRPYWLSGGAPPPPSDRPPPPS